MDPVDVTVISCLYGRSHDGFFWDWLTAIKQLDPAPAEVIVATDRYRHLTDGVLEVSYRRHGWRYPQPFFLNAALAEVKTEWVWICDIDDVAFPDALAGVTEIPEDVLQFGYERSDGEIYLPPRLDAWEVIQSERNPFVAGSAIRTGALLDIGGFRDVALQDWDLWLRLAHAGATFAASERPRFFYRRHQAARGIRELTVLERPMHVAEMAA